jgi:hypothetical protein
MDKARNEVLLTHQIVSLVCCSNFCYTVDTVCFVPNKLTILARSVMDGALMISPDKRPQNPMGGPASSDAFCNGRKTRFFSFAKITWEKDVDLV